MLWYGVDVLPSFKFGWAGVEAWTNLDRLLAGLRALPSPIVLPNLKHVALGAIFGAQDKLWQSDARIVDDVGMIGHRIAECAKLIEGIIHASSASHICFRAGAGPLSLLKTANWTEQASDWRLHIPLVNVHFDLDTTAMPAVLGQPVRWLLEAKGADKMGPKDEMRDVCTKGGLFVGDIKKGREKSEKLPQTGYDLEIYASSDRARPYTTLRDPRPTSEPVELNAKEERELVGRFTGDMLEHFNKTVWVSSSSDVISWRASIDSPPCEACGWVFER
jgi:hypothetical protein